MKQLTNLSVCLVLLTSASLAQDSQGPSLDPGTPILEQLQQVGPPGEGVYAIIEAGAHSRRWAKIQEFLQPDGSVQVVTNSYVEVGSGLNRLDENGRWVPAQAVFEIINGDAVARNTAHRVVLTSPTAALPVDAFSPDGKRFSSRVLGISYYSATTGRSVLIAQPKATEGQLVLPNRVVYPDCFDGGFQADLVYTVTLSGLEQDLVFRERPTSAADAGMQPEDTNIRLELLTEFTEAPEPRVQELVLRTELDPVKRSQMVEPDETDQTLSFGSMVMGYGAAFNLGDVPRQESSFQTLKHWQVVDQRKVLFEGIVLDRAMQSLAALPENPQAANTQKRKPVLVASRKELPPKTRVIDSPGPILIAQKSPAQAGFCMDYSLVASATDFTFAGDTTYFVTTAVTISNSTVIEGGTVIKFERDSETNRVWLWANGPITCKTDSWRPAYLTARDDDTVGEILPTSTGNPTNTYGYYNLMSYNTGTNTDLHHLNSRYAGTGLALFYNTTNTVRDCQLFKCAYGLIGKFGTTNQYPSIAMRNVLMDQNSVAVGAENCSITAEHATFRDGWGVFILITTNVSFMLTNSIIAGVPNATTGYTNMFGVENASSSGFFQAVGAGNSYLANSSYRDQGNSAINASLLAELKNLTTYPPIILSNDFATTTVLSPQAGRDVDTPDLGYHYSPLDYCVSGLNLTNTTLLLTNGVAVGVYGSKGIILRSGANFVSEGTPMNLNRLVRYDTVQEQPLFAGNTNTPICLLSVNSAAPAVRLRFTDVSLTANNDSKRYFLQSSGAVLNPLTLTHSQLRGVYLDINSTAGSGMSINFTNNLVERSTLSFSQESGYYPFTLSVYNQLFYGGTNAFNYRDNSTTWTINDNFFYTNVLSGGTTNFVNSNNGYHNTSALPGAATSQVITNVVFLTGPLGRYYYPTNTSGGSLSDLINSGSRNATNAGLYHFTTSISQVKETNSVVDIGFHYVAVATTGYPYDEDSDGWPDYFEDRSGNGTVDTGETDWQNASDLGLRVFITEPKSNANIP